MIHYDTNVAVKMLNGDVAYRARHDRLIASGETVAISTIVVFELWFGVARSQRYEDNAALLRAYLARIQVHPFSEDDALTAGEIRATLKRSGTPIGPYDLLIAAHAVRLGATMVTGNVREFSRVPGLKWEDWSAS